MLTNATHYANHWSFLFSKLIALGLLVSIGGYLMSNSETHNETQTERPVPSQSSMKDAGSQAVEEDDSNWNHTADARTP